MAEDGTTPPSGEDLLSSIRRLVSLREAEALVLTGAQRVAPEEEDTSDTDPPAWLSRINTATLPERSEDDPFAHRAPTTRSEDEAWPALSKESLGLVRAGMDYPSDEFEDEDEPVWSGSVMRHAKPEAPEPFLLTDPAQAESSEPDAPLALTEPVEATEPPLPLTERVTSAENLWDDVDQLAARLSAAPEAEAPAPAVEDADLAAQIEAAITRDIENSMPALETGAHPEPVATAAPADEPQIAPAEPAPALPAALADEELNALVAAIIREELRGELGMRITRNVRKLVRREIYRAIANGELNRE